jgi:hypothetical protein
VGQRRLQRRYSLRCGWTTRRGRRCRMLAGEHTRHPGYGPCHCHGGAKAHRAWEKALDIARELNVTPWEALLKSVRIAAGRAAWVDQQLADAVRRNDGEPGTPEVKGWLKESRLERTLLARMAKAAVDAGVAERLVRQTELEGEIVAEVLGRVLDKLGLPPEQRVLAFDEAHRQLLALESPSGEATTIEGEWKPFGDDERPGGDAGDAGGDQR